MLTIENLYFSYTGSAPWLLENVDFHLAGGEYISIVGNNGSGKSTLLKIILGFLKPGRSRAAPAASATYRSGSPRMPPFPSPWKKSSIPTGNCCI